VDDAVTLIRSKRELVLKVAAACGIKVQAVYQWEHVPVARVLIVSQVIKVPPHKIRPDYYPAPPRAPRARKAPRKRPVSAANADLSS
jgi:hypothetical protein